MIMTVDSVAGKSSKGYEKPFTIFGWNFQRKPEQ